MAYDKWSNRDFRKWQKQQKRQFEQQRSPGALPVPSKPDYANDAEMIALQDDPVAAMRNVSGQSGPGGPQWTRMPLGLAGKNWQWTTSQSHVLALGPPRSEAGKTAAAMIPVILAAAGPVVAATTKPDILDATVMARAQRGRVWWFAADGDLEYLPAGMLDLRWSPITGAGDWGVALETAKLMTDTLSTEGVRSGAHWKDRAGDLLAAVVHWAALSGHTMREARDIVYTLFDEVDGRTVGQVVSSWLSTHGAPDAAMMLGSVLHAGREERASIMSTASNALRGYRLPGAMRSTEEPNFDPEDFVRGGAYGVRADTIYILASSKNQEMVAPLVVGLLGQIRAATYRVYRENPAMWPVTFALDEMYGLAPIPDLPHMLSDAGSQGLLIAGAVQDLTLIKSRWPNEADGFLTLFGHALIYPGVRDIRTLEAVSKLIGMWDRPKTTVTQTPQPPHYVNINESTARSTERVPIFDPSQISQGIDPTDQQVLIHLLPGGWQRLDAMPYWWFPPWPALLSKSLELALSGSVPYWREREAQMSGKQPPVPDLLMYLPIPNLRMWATAKRYVATPRCDQKWIPRYNRALQMVDQVRRAPAHNARYAHPASPAATADFWGAVSPKNRRMIE